MLSTDLIYIFLVILHVVGVALGVGGVVLSDIFFYRIMKDKKISRVEFDFLKVVSNVVVVGLIFLIISGVGFIGRRYQLLSHDDFVFPDRFWAKMCIVGVIILDGIYFHVRALSLIKKQVGAGSVSSEYVRAMPSLLRAGSISVISWFSALILGSWKSLSLSFWPIITIYVSVVCLGLVAATLIAQQEVHHGR